MNIGSKIKEERLKRKWTQEQVATLLNVSRSAVSSWEVGRNYPDLVTLVSISDLFDISLDNLLREDMEMTKTVTKKVKMNKYYKVILIIIGILGIFYLGFNTYLRTIEKKYHSNLEKNGWDIYFSDQGPGFNEFELKENNITYYTTILPTGLVGFPLAEQKLTVITKKEGLVMRVQDPKNIEIVISKDNDSSAAYNSKVKVNKDLQISESNETISDKTKKFNEKYIKEHQSDYQEMINKTLIKIDDIKS